MEIYIHIPFCVQKCLYCDFLSFAGCNESVQDEYTEALCREIEFWGELLQGYRKNAETVFIGGGTPSILSTRNTEKILCKLNEEFVINSNAEFTTEANPGTVSEDKLRTYKSLGINRISFGLQSTNDGELKSLGRIHTFDDFIKSYGCAQKCGLHNINIDIMSALPSQTVASYTETLHRVCSLNPSHISAYSLIVEENTPFYTMDLDLPSEDCEREMYYETERILSDYGYQRYEISNYSHKGFECRHNLGYWTGKDYLGIGLGASSYMDGIRFKNCTSLHKYIDRKYSVRDYTETVNANTLADNGYEEITVNSNEDKMREFMFLGLRLTQGVSIKEFEDKFHVRMKDVFSEEIDKNMKLSLLCRKGSDNDRIALTGRGLDLANVVMADFV